MKRGIQIKLTFGALGCILFELSFRKKAFNGDMAVLSYSLSQRKLEIPSEHAPDPQRMIWLPVKSPAIQVLETTIHAMLELDPTKRPTATHLGDTFSSPDAKLERKVVVAKTSPIHGVNVHIDYSKCEVERNGFSSTIRPSNTDCGAIWAHFAIPTPVIVNDQRLRCNKAVIRFQSGHDTRIGAIHIFDGENPIAMFNDLNFGGPLQDAALQISDLPEIRWGINISLNICYNFMPSGVTGKKLLISPNNHCIVIFGVAIEFV